MGDFFQLGEEAARSIEKETGKKVTLINPRFASGLDEKLLSDLKENHRVLYTNLMTSRKLVTYLDDIERQATTMFLRLVKELAEKENVTEKLKATDQMLWVQKINNIRNRATEIVNAELIFA